MDIKELKDKPRAELERILAEKTEELRKYRFQAHDKQLKNVRAIRNTRRDIARINSILSNTQN